jgi:hypothetical protein
VSTYSLVKRGVINLTSADVGTSKDVGLAAAVKTGSAFIVCSVKSNLKPITVRRGTVSAVEPNTSPQLFGVTAVTALAQAELRYQICDTRTGDSRGATLELTDVDEVTLKWLGGALSVTEEIVAEYEITEHHLTRRGATLRLLDEDTVRAEWDAQLTTGETISIAYEVYDIEDVGDDLKEILFRMARVLGFQGENSIQDLMNYDQAGNPTTFRVRVFDSEANKDAATVDLPEGDGLQTGELSRYKTTLNWSAGRNRPTSISSSRTHLLTPTPGVS